VKKTGTALGFHLSGLAGTAGVLRLKFVKRFFLFLEVFMLFSV
jgi:hypothetical protein